MAKQSEKLSKQDNSLAAMFAEAEAKEVERDGILLRLGTKSGRTQEFQLWISRLTYQQRMRIQQHTSLPIEGIGHMIGEGGGTIEGITAFIAASMYQHSGKLPGMDGVMAWIKQVLNADDAVFDCEVLTHDEEAQTGGDAPE